MKIFASTDHDSDCIVRRFGNEGVGMQCLLYAPWSPGELITQRISGKEIREENVAKSGKQFKKWHLSFGS